MESSKGFFVVQVSFQYVLGVTFLNGGQIQSFNQLNGVHKKERWNTSKKIESISIYRHVMTRNDQDKYR